MGFARIAQVVQQDGAEVGGVGGDGVRLLLQRQAFDQVAEGREAGGDELRRRVRADGDADALDNGSLALVRHALVLDAGLEAAKQLQALVDVGRGLLLQRREQGGRLLLHVQSGVGARGVVVAAKFSGALSEVYMFSLPSTTTTTAPVHHHVSAHPCTRLLRFVASGVADT